MNGPPTAAAPPPSTRTAIVVGAGIGGLAAALALKGAGWQVRVLERAGTLEQTGFGLALAPGGMAALDELGVGQTIRRRGHVPALIEIRRPDGTAMRRVDITSFSPKGAPPLVMVQRAVLHACLGEALGGAGVELGTDVVSCSTDDASVTVAGRETIAGNVLVGADGVASRLRRTLHPSEPPPRPSGYWALRGLARGVSDRLGHLSGVACLGPGIEAAAIRAGDDAIYWYMSLLAGDVEKDAASAEAVVDRCVLLRDPTLRAIMDASRGGAMRLDQLFVREVLPTWGAGRTTLLGDAAHPVLPHTGQGATLALQDAVALGLALRADADPAARLRRYEAARHPPSARLVRRGPRAARVTTTHNAAVTWLRDAAIRFAPLGVLAAAARAAPVRDPHRSLR